MRAKELAKILGGELYGEDLPFKAFSIDSRKIKEGEVFVPLKGKRFDGHTFIEDALKVGVGSLGRIDFKPKRGKFYLKVEEPYKALIKLAKFKRQNSRATFIGVCGSAGKTTTKELIAFLLSKRFKTYKSEGNLNSRVGLPLCLANLKENVDFGVFELGASQEGDVLFLSKILRPKIRVITALGEEHLETFKSLEGVIRGNGEIFKDFKEDDWAVVPHYAKKFYKLKRVITFGEGGELRAECVRVEEEGTYFTFEGKEVFIPLISKGIVNNTLCAFGVLRALGLEPKDFIKHLRDFYGVEGRMRTYKVKGITLIDDTYNSNPLSLRNAVETLLSLKGRRIGVFGDMLELGRYSKKYHEELGKLSRPLDLTLLYGREVVHSLKENPKALYFKSKGELANYLKENLKEGDLVLFKASRGMRLEEVLREVLSFLNSL